MRRWEDGKDDQKSTEKAKEHPGCRTWLSACKARGAGRGLEWLFPHLLISSSHLLIFSSAALPPEPLLRSLQNHQPPH